MARKLSVEAMAWAISSSLEQKLLANGASEHPTHFPEHRLTPYPRAAGLGSLSYGISSLLSPLSGLVYHRIGHRCCATIGTFISVGGLIGSSFARNTPELFLAYAVMFGLGTSLAYTPSMVVCK